MKNQSSQKSIWNLVSGLIFAGLGGYIVYNHFFGEEVIATFRLVLSFAMIAYGAYKLYNYFSAE